MVYDITTEICLTYELSNINITWCMCVFACVRVCACERERERENLIPLLTENTPVELLTFNVENGFCRMGWQKFAVA
jgi:hypothetical protein